MTPLMNELHQDHQHISALLTILKNKLATLELGSRPNFILMAEVVDYLIDYGDLYHHRKEEILYAVIRANHPATDAVMAQQQADHEALKALTAALRQDIEGALMDAPLSLPAFIRQMRRWLDKQHQHLSQEETKVFPLIERHLTAADLATLDADLPRWEEPLPGGSLATRYDKLYEAMIDDLG